MLENSLIAALLEQMVQEQGTDLYINVGVPPVLRIGDRLLPMRTTVTTPTQINAMCEQLLPVEKQKEFKADMELNFSFSWNDEARFRANFFRQQQQAGIVIRRINTEIPTVESLGLPPIYSNLVMQKSGLVLVVGKAGSGKSTSLAAMLNYRNTNGSGHVVTVEDPIEYIHKSNRCLFTQRDVGVDTFSFSIALKNALRQRPDVVLVGEIRDMDVMGQVLSMAESGHLCLATLHAANATKTIERILDFFPDERHSQVLKSLANQLRGIMAQRLVDTVQGGKTLVCDVLLNDGAVTSLIQERKMVEIRDIMSKSRGLGMQTFDQVLFDLFVAGVIDERTAIMEAESSTEVNLRIHQWRTDHK